MDREHRITLAIGAALAIPALIVGINIGKATASPEVVTKTRVVTKPAPAPETIIKTKTEWKEVHVVEPLPASCARLPKMIAEWIRNANEVNYLGGQAYDLIQETRYDVLTNPSAGNAVVMQLRANLDKQSVPLRRTFEIQGDLKDVYDTCSSDVKVAD